MVPLEDVSLINDLISSFIQINVEKKNLANQLITKITKDKKNHTNNNKKISNNLLVQDFPCILFSPESLSSIKEGPEKRRNLIDDMLLIHDPKNSQIINEFRKCLKFRNKILRNFSKGEVSKDQTMAILEGVNQKFIETSSTLTYQRICALKDILNDLNVSICFISDDSELKVEINYLMSEENFFHKEKNEIEEKIYERMRQLCDAEMATGTSLVGPHKHDIQFLFNGQDSRYYCSQGQQRALILAFKLAQITYHYKIYNDYPLLMLDDVLSELDAAKRKKFVEFLKKVESQIFVTTTSISSIDLWLDDLIAVFSVEKGVIIQK